MDYSRGYRSVGHRHESSSSGGAGGDKWLFRSALVLLTLGLVMVASTSMAIAERKYGNLFYFIERQVLFLAIGLAAAFIVYRIPIVTWYRFGPLLLLLAFVLLGLVLIPGVSKLTKGSYRWITLGPLHIQVSEIVKICVLAYVAGYLVRHSSDARETLAGFVKPMTVVLLVSGLLLLQPDFGAAAVLTATMLILMYLGGVRLAVFSGVSLVVVIGFVLLALVARYRLNRVLVFSDPWQDPTNHGYQLINSLMAFGTGGFLGAGLGSSIHKLSYLPEPHTDFLFAVVGEELGLVGASLVIAAFLVLIARSFTIASLAMSRKWNFHAYLCYGIGVGIGLQALISIGVNLGVLPTKGLVLPLMSYGGSSLVMTLIALTLLFRVEREMREEQQPRRIKRGRI